MKVWNVYILTLAPSFHGGSLLCRLAKHPDPEVGNWKTSLRPVLGMKAGAGGELIQFLTSTHQLKLSSLQTQHANTNRKWSYSLEYNTVHSRFAQLMASIQDAICRDRVTENRDFVSRKLRVPFDTPSGEVNYNYQTPTCMLEFHSREYGRWYYMEDAAICHRDVVTISRVLSYYCYYTKFSDSNATIVFFHYYCELGILMLVIHSDSVKFE